MVLLKRCHCYSVSWPQVVVAETPPLAPLLMATVAKSSTHRKPTSGLEEWSEAAVKVQLPQPRELCCCDKHVGMEMSGRDLGSARSLQVGLNP